MPRLTPLAALVALTACSALDLFGAEVVDDPNCARPRRYFRDGDGDGYGTNAWILEACLRPPGYASRGGDCDDRAGAAAVYPGAPERCDGVDTDCSGDDVPPEDGDGDGHAPPAAACVGGPLPKDDCDDARADVNPGAAEVCDARDNNCAGGADEAPAADEACGGPQVRASVCRAGACITTCVRDRGDCDRDRRNGCEADLATSARHCGACGMSCGAGSACAGGVCRSAITHVAAGRAVSTDSAGRVTASTCAVRGGDASSATPARVLCWGSNRYGQLGLPPAALASSRTPVVFELPLGLRAEQLAAGGRGACVRAVDARAWGSLTCWGVARRDGAVEAPHRLLDNDDVAQVAMELALDGRDSLCAVTASDRRLRCWGSNVSGNLGPGETFLDAPTEVPVPAPVVSVAMGPAHTCAASEDAVYCWGRNDAGQLGDGARSARATPAARPSYRAPTGARILSIVAGRDFSCAVTGTLDRLPRTFTCWGANPGNWFRAAPAGTPPTVPTSLTAPVTVAASDGALFDLVAGGARWCLGGPLANGAAGEGFQCAGELFHRGNTRVFQSLAPIPALLGVAELNLGPDHACGLRRAGDVLCWGENAAGQCGDGSTALRRAPTVVSALSHRARLIPSARDFLVLRADASLTTRSGALATLLASYAARDVALDDLGGACVATRQGGLHCTNFTAALPSTPFLSPVLDPAVAGRVVLQVAMARVTPGAEAAVVCARVESDRVTCYRPQLRTSPAPAEPAWAYTPLSPSPTAALDLVGLVGAPLGAHFCAWSARGEAYCWGANGDGQVDPARRGEQRPTATRVERLHDVVAIALGSRHSCALRAAGGVVCWGQTRLATEGDALTSVPELVDATAVSAGAEHTCALRRTGRVVCWGSNGYGQLGDGSTLDRAAPAEVRGLEDADAVFAGGEYTCARRRSGQIVCWGRNDEGQLDDGTFDDRSVPTPTLQVP